MAIQTVFKRIEFKYLLNSEQRDTITRAMQPYMTLDDYGRTTIRNLYFDTDTYRLIRRSIEKPVYKEKLRIRSYTQAYADTTVFVELKKKYNHVVYKRRLPLPEAEAMAWLNGAPAPRSTQIAREIAYCLQYYETVHPTLFLAYDREAHYANDGSDLRITFDDTIVCRQDRLSLQEPADGISLLGGGQSLMEIKCSGGLPLWLTRLLTEQHLYRTSFSKYGTAYQTLIYPKLREELRYVGHTV